MELDNTRISPHSLIPTNRPNMAQVDQSEIYDLVLSTTIQQYTNIVFCTLLVYDTRKYSTRFHYAIVLHSLRGQ